MMVHFTCKLILGVSYFRRSKDLINFFFLETFHINPQLHLILSEMEEVVISLNQHSIMEPKVIGFTSYSLPKACMDSTGKDFFKKNKSLVNSQYTNSRQV